MTNERTVFYFAYGSNTDPERFRSRVGTWRSARPAWLDGYVLRFAASVRSEGGGGAVVDRRAGHVVAGVLFEIGTDQMAALDRAEFAASRDTGGSGRRIAVTVRTDAGPLDAQIYTVVDDGAHRPPSERYLGHILRGLELAGHPEEALAQVRATAERAADGR